MFCFMERYSRFIIICLIFIWPLAAIPSSADDRVDSLQNIVSESNDPVMVMGSLATLSGLFRQKPEEVPYLKKLLDEALKVDSVNIAYKAIGNLGRYFYNSNDKDSLIYWAGYMDSLVKVKNSNPNAYYIIHSCVSKTFLYSEEYERSVDEALRLYNRAQNTGHEYGIICSSETLGSIYQVCRRDSDAVASFQKALEGLEAMNGDVYYRVRILACLIESSLRLNRFEELPALLKNMERTLELSDEFDRQNDVVRKINFYRWQMHSFYVDLYLGQNRMADAKKALDIASAYAKGVTLHEYPNHQVSYYLSVKARYNSLIKNYPTALAAVDSILKYSSEQEDLKLKIDILCDQGQFKEAAILYKRMIQLVNEKNEESFIRQVNRLRVLYDVNDKELHAKELQISNMKVDAKQHQLLLSMLVSLIILIVLYILYLLLKRTRRLKDELVVEKKSLIESKQKLHIEKKKAEADNLMKSAFIANISHEIRTPLNAIVGFSTLLAEPSFEEEKRSFITIINKNSDLLLDLINDVLDLSRLEAGSLKFVFTPCELTACCKEALNSIQQCVAEGVKLTQTSSSNHFILQTDPLRLQQLLLNLLSNAAKFTTEGEINLSFEINEEKRQVLFFVTDTGSGIPLGKQERIFERFEKLDDYMPGTGLGLSICRMIAIRLGGSVMIDSTYTTGARFIFIHPFNPSDSEDRLIQSDQ